MCSQRCTKTYHAVFNLDDPKGALSDPQSACRWTTSAWPQTTELRSPTSDFGPHTSHLTADTSHRTSHTAHTWRLVFVVLQSIFQCVDLLEYTSPISRALIHFFCVGLLRFLNAAVYWWGHQLFLSVSIHLSTFHVILECSSYVPIHFSIVQRVTLYFNHSIPFSVSSINFSMPLSASVLLSPVFSGPSFIFQCLKPTLSASIRFSAADQIFQCFSPLVVASVHLSMPRSCFQLPLCHFQCLRPLTSHLTFSL